MKNNDWIVANINNPGFTPGDFRASGLDMDNTQILSKEEYLQSDFIKTNDAFKDANGDFSEKKFSDFYDSALQGYNVFSSIEDGFQYDQFDARRSRKPNSQTKTQDMFIYQVSNPDESVIGKGWINETVESPFSTRELAEQNKVYDYETGEFCSYSPNEHALLSDPIEYFKDLFKEPLVLAAYDEEGDHEDPITGEVMHHQKGDLKLNEDGKYYYETLAGRSVAGKQVLSKFDVLTVDGDSFNKLDFWDSDDKEKSIGGSIMKGVATIAPLFMGDLGVLLSTAQVVREFGKVMPFVDGLINTVAGNRPDTAFSKWANNWSARMTSFTSDVSDYSQKNMFSFENFANLASDVALQWGQQQVIAKAYSKLRGSKNLMENAEKTAFDTWKKVAPIQRQSLVDKGVSPEEIQKMVGVERTWKDSMLGNSLLTQNNRVAYSQMEKLQKLGADVSLVYMALISNPDVYQTMLEHDCTKREAAIVTLASTVAMFSVDKFLHLGEMFFDNDDLLMSASIRNTLRREVAGPDGKSGIVGILAKEAKESTTTAAGTQNFFKRAVGRFHNTYSKFWDDVENHTLGFWGKAVGEGIEEVSEEFATDLSKQMYELAASWSTTDKLLNDLTTDNVGAFNDPGNNKDWFKELFARYSINFLGGFMGGGIFYGKERFDRGDWRRDTSHDSLIQNVYMYGKDEVMRILDKYHKQGKLGSTKKSLEFQTLPNGDRVFLTANKDGESINDVVYRNLRNSIESIDKIINDKELIMSNDEMMHQMTLGDGRFQLMHNLLADDYTKGLRDQIQDVLQSYVKTNQQIDQIDKEILTADSNIELKKKKREIKDKLIEHSETLKKQLEQFKSGEMAFDYMNQVLFNIDERISGSYITPNFTTWLAVYKKNVQDGYELDPMTIEQFNTLNDEEKESIRDEYRTYIQTAKKEDQVTGYKAFKYIRDLTKHEIENLNLTAPDYEMAIKAYEELRDNTKNPILDYAKARVKPEDFSETSTDPDFKIDYDEKLPWETLEAYNQRNILPEESPEAFAIRKDKRIKMLQDYYTEKVNSEKYIESLSKLKDLIRRAGYMLDNTTRRQLKMYVAQSQKELIKKVVESTYSLEGMVSSEAAEKIKEKLLTLPDDMNEEQVNEIFESIKELVHDDRKPALIEFIKRNSGLQELLDAGDVGLHLDPNDKNKTPIALLMQAVANMHTSSQDIYDQLKTAGYIKDGVFNSKKFTDDLRLYIFSRNKSLDSSTGTDSYKYLIETEDDVVNAIYSKLSKSKKDGIKRILTGTDETSSTDVKRAALLKEDWDEKKLDGDILKAIQDLLSSDISTELREKILNIDGVNLSSLSVTAQDAIEEFLENKIKLGENSIEYIFPSKDRSVFDVSRIEAIIQYPLASDEHGVIDVSKLYIPQKADGTIDYELLAKIFNIALKVNPANVLSGNHNGIHALDLQQMLKSKFDATTGKYVADVKSLNEAFSTYGNIHILDLTLDGSPFIDTQSWDGYEPTDDEYVESEYNENGILSELYDQDEKTVDYILGFLINQRIKNNPIWSYLQEINQTRSIKNPIVDILKKLNNVMGEPLLDVETLFDEIEKQRDQQGYSKFTLKPSQIEQLQDAYRLLDLARSMMYAAYDSTTLQNPFPHNKLMNSVIEKYHLNLDLFPLLKGDIGQTFILNISEIMATIGELNPKTGTYTGGSILEWNRINSYNKKQALIDSKLRATQSQLQFFQQNKNLLQNTTSGLNLVPNIDAILANSSYSQEQKLYKIQEDFYKAVEKYFEDNEGATLGDLFDAIGLQRLFIGGAKDSFINQDVADLNGELTYGRLTPLNKAMMAITNACINIEDRKRFQAGFILANNNFASLSDQEIITESGLANIANPKRYNEGIDWMYKHYVNSGERIDQIKIYSTSITGNGGAGKTEVCIRSNAEYAKYIKGLNDEEISLSGPTSKQLNALKDIGVGKVETVDDILKRIYGETLFNEIVSEINPEKKKEDLKHLLSISEGVRVIDSEKEIKYKDTKTKVIIVDEATWVDTARISMLSKYIHDVGGSLILVGDNYQTGHTVNGMRTNINPEIIFTGRTSRLSITLRDCNIQKYNNTLRSAELLKEFELITLNDPNRFTKLKQWIDKVDKDYGFAYYNRDILNGDIVIQSLDDAILDHVDLVTKTKADGTVVKEKIAYIGSDAATIKKIQDKFGVDMVEQYDDIQSVQGNEFSNIIIDIKVPKPNHVTRGRTNNENIEGTAALYLNWITQINTLSTRGKNAAIFIDSTGQLKLNLHNQEETTKNNKSNFNPDAIAAFNDDAKASFKKFGIIGINYKTNPKTNSTTTTTEEGKPETKPVTPGTRFKIETSHASSEEDSVVYDPSKNEEEAPTHIGDPGSKAVQQFQDDSSYDGDNMQPDDFAVINPDRALVYGDNTVSGMQYEEKIIKYTTRSGKVVDNKYRLYKPSNSDNSEFYDADAVAQVLMKTNPELELDKGFGYKKDGRAHIVFDKYETLKACILHRERLEGSDEVRRTLQGIVGNPSEGCIMTEEDYEAIIKGDNISVEVSEYNYEADKTRFNYIGRNHLDESKEAMGIGEKKLVITLVATYNLGGDSSKKGKITLGFFANPEQFSKSADKIKGKLDKDIKRREKEGSDKNRSIIRRDREYLKLLESESEDKNPILNYKRRIRGYTNQYEDASKPGSLLSQYNEKTKTLSIPIDKDVEEVDFTGNVGIYTNVRNHDGAVPRVRLAVGENNSRYFNGVTFDEFNNRVWYSPVYIYRPGQGISFTTLDAGRSCIFITTDPVLAIADLLRVYCQQQSPDYIGARTVRLVKLDNVGVTWSELANYDTRKLYRTASTTQEDYTQSLPFSTNVFAIRQLIALHNWRYDINTFQSQLRIACQKGGIFNEFFTSYDQLISDSKSESSKMKQALILLHETYQNWKKINENKDKTENDFQDYFASTRFDGVDLNIHKLAVAINEFNNSLDSTCRRFRLGIGNITTSEEGSTSAELRGKTPGETRNRHQIRRIYASEEGVYQNEVKDGKHVYGIYLTPDLFNDFDTSTQEIYNIIGKLGDGGLEIRAVNKETGESRPIDPNIRLSSKFVNAEGKTETLVYALFNSGFTINDDAAALKLMRKLPSILLKIGGRAIAISVGESVSVDGEEKIKLPDDPRIQFRRKSDEPRTVRRSVLEHQYIPKFEEKDGKLEEIKTTNPEVVSVKHSVNMGSDFNLMMELLFHGTTMNVVESYLTRRQHKIDEETGKPIPYEDIEPQSTDAEFKYGFFVDPQAKKLTSSSESDTNTLYSSFAQTTAKPYMFSVAARIAKPIIWLRGKTKKASDVLTESKEKVETVLESERIIKSFIDLSSATLTINEYREAINNLKTALGTLHDTERNKIIEQLLVFDEDVDKTKAIRIFPAYTDFNEENNRISATATATTLEGETYSFVYEVIKNDGIVQIHIYNKETGEPAKIDRSKQTQEYLNDILNVMKDRLSRLIEDEAEADKIITDINNALNSADWENKMQTLIEEFRDIGPDVFYNLNFRGEGIKTEVFLKHNTEEFLGKAYVDIYADDESSTDEEILDSLFKAINGNATKC